MQNRIAQVVFPLPTEKSFSYIVPEGLTEMVQRGSRVWAPLGSRLLTGFVVDLKQETEISNLKRILDVLDPYPAFDSQMLRLTRWVAEYYLCSLGEVLNSALPSGVRFGGSEYLILRNPELHPPLPEAIKGEKEQAVLESLFQRGTRSLLTLERELRREGLYAAIYDLEQMGYVAVKSRERRLVRLTEGDPGELEQQIDELKRKAPRQAHLLRILRENGGHVAALQLSRNWGVGADVVDRLERKGLVELCFEEPQDSAVNEKTCQGITEVNLSPTQARAFRQIKRALDGGHYQTILLQSSPGADRTPLYLQAISAVLRREKGVLMLVPEVFLTARVFKHLQATLGLQAVVLHSRLSDAERYRLWRQVREGRKRVVIGPRSAVFAPVVNLGLIVVEEEQDSSYKCESNPRYHARDVAIVRAKMADAVVLLGSSAPSLESYHNASTGKFSLCRLSREVNNPLPKVTIVDIRGLRSANAREILSPLVCERLKLCLQKGKQAVLFQNRRGYATYIQCSQCGFVPQCQNCQVSLTYHQEEHQMVCHYCGFRQEAPSICPQCLGHDWQFGGVGTELVEKTLRSLFPRAKVLRLDLDTTKRKQSYRRLLQFSQGDGADILLGTQMIAKAMDFPRVGLVAIVQADSCLNLPDFRAGEKTFHLLTQLASQLTEGEILVQTYSSGDWTFRCFKNFDFDKFARRELVDRRQLNYPPWSRLVSIVFQGKISEDVVSIAEKYSSLLQEAAFETIQILGPSEAPLGKIKGAFRCQILLKGKSSKALRELVRQCAQKLKGKRGVRMTVDVDPVEMM